MDRQKELESALAQEVCVREKLAAQLKDLQDFIVAASQLHSAEARQAALSQKAREILEAPRPIEKKAALLEEVELQANEEWAEELGLGPSELQMLTSCEQRGDHLFVEPVSPHAAGASPKKFGQPSKPVLILGHS